MTEQTPADPARKPRYDAFDGTRRRKFLDALGRTGCLRDAARKAEVSHQTVYNHQQSDPTFARQCELALNMAGTDIELHAWERGVVGVEEPIWKNGEVVGTRIRRSDNILRLLLQGTKRKKYGSNPGFTRKRLVKVERKNIEREVRAEHAARIAASSKDVSEKLMERLGKMAEGIRREKLAQGWTEIADSEWVPPGWVRADNVPAALAWPDNRAERELDSV